MVKEDRTYAPAKFSSHTQVLNALGERKRPTKLMQGHHPDIEKALRDLLTRIHDQPELAQQLKQDSLNNIERLRQQLLSGFDSLDFAGAFHETSPLESEDPIDIDWGEPLADTLIQKLRERANDNTRHTADQIDTLLNDCESVYEQDLEDDSTEKAGELHTRPSPEDSAFINRELAQYQQTLNSYLSRQNSLQIVLDRVEQGVEMAQSLELLHATARTLNKGFQKFNHEFSKYLKNNPQLEKQCPKQHRQAYQNSQKALRNDIVLQKHIKSLEERLNKTLDIEPEEQPTIKRTP